MDLNAVLGQLTEVFYNVECVKLIIYVALCLS